MWMFRCWYTIAKIGNASFYPFVDFIQHDSIVLEITELFKDKSFSLILNSLSANAVKPNYANVLFFPTGVS